jgi:hypothetical protein
MLPERTLNWSYRQGMEDMFEIMSATEKEKVDEAEIRLGVRLKIGSHETTCSISGPCASFEALEIEVQAIRNNLDRVLGRAKEIFRKSPAQEGLVLNSDMKAEEIWSILSDVADEGLLIRSFNGLEDVKRREVAEHVLTKCSVFSGKGVLFSERYNSELGLLE